MITTAVTDAFAADAIAAMLQVEYRVALIRPNAAGSYGAHTASYDDLGGDEVVGAGYQAGGKTLVNGRAVKLGDRWCMQFDDVRWPNADIIAAGALIYSPTRGGSSACVLGFNAIHAAVGGDTFVLPIMCPIRI